MKKGKKSEYLATGICIGILLLFLFSIGMRFCVRQILVKRLGIENAFTHLVFWDDNSMALNVDWAKKFPFDTLTLKKSDEKLTKIPLQKLPEKINDTTSNQYIQLVENLVAKVESYSNDLLAGRIWIIRLYKGYLNQIGWKEKKEKGDASDNILYMENGYLAYQEEERTPGEIREIADSVLAFSDFLKKEDISFYYVNVKKPLYKA